MSRACEPWPVRSSLTRDDRVRELLEMYRAAAQKFIDKCNSGRAFSAETKAEMNAALDKQKEWGL